MIDAILLTILAAFAIRDIRQHITYLEQGDSYDD